MLEFKKFIDAFEEVYNLKSQSRNEVVNIAVRHLSNKLKEVENFKAIWSYIKEFIAHYDAMKERHLEAEVWQRIEKGDTFFNACKEWDI
jgi:hypothetical protein